MIELAFLHGFTGAPADFDGVRAELERAGIGLRLMAPWIVGHGPLARGALGARASSCDFEGELERLARYFEGQLTEPAHLVGYSLGARLGLGLLLEEPRLFRSATLVSVHPGLESAEERRARRNADESWRELLLAGEGSIWNEERIAQNIERFVEKWQSQPLFSSEARLEPGLRERIRARRLGHDPRGLADCLGRTGLGCMPAYATRVRVLKLPITLCAGTLDQKFLELARGLARLVPHCRLDAIEGSGHNPVVERPTELAASLTKDLCP